MTTEQSPLHNIGQTLNGNNQRIQDEINRCQDPAYWRANYWQVKQEPTQSTCTIHGRVYECEEIKIIL